MNTPIRNTQNERIDYTFARGHESERKSDWIIVLGHGLTGDKDRPIIVDTANALNAAGFDTVRISYAGNGQSEGDFRDATISKEVADLRAVFDSLSILYPKITYIGHSMGSAVGTIFTVLDNRIDLLISLAGMVDTKAFALEEFGSVTPDEGYMWEESTCPLSKKFMHDLTETVRNVAPLAETITCPWLLIHGTEDDVVLPKDSECISALTPETSTLIFIKDANHCFDNASHKSRVLMSITEWLEENTQ